MANYLIIYRSQHLTIGNLTKKCEENVAISIAVKLVVIIVWLIDNVELKRLTDHDSIFFTICTLLYSAFFGVRFKMAQY